MSDWITDESPRALERIFERIEPRLPARPKRMRRFRDRLEPEFEGIFRLLHRLYGWRFDFAWWLEEAIAVAAGASLRHPHTPPSSTGDWVLSSETVWAQAYLDRFVGSASRLPDAIPHLQSLGVTHLHLMPPYLTPPGAADGGYAVSDYRTLRNGLGSVDELRSAIAALDAAGIGVVLDFVANHTAEDHPWARAAVAGDTRHRDFYFIYPDRTVPDRIAPHLREIFPSRGGDAFTWRPELVGGGGWVWTTFYSFQWDLDYSNPDVFCAMLGELLYLAGLGLSAIRMDATPFLWKREGTSCENLPEAHVVLQLFAALTRSAAPGVELLSEAIVHPDDVSKFVRPDECRLGYNPFVMSTIWEAMATRDTGLLRESISHRSALPEGCNWISYLRLHDDIGWGFADEDAVGHGIDPAGHRSFLNAFYSGEFPGSFARGSRFQDNPRTGDARMSGTLASLAGLEAAREEGDPAAVEVAVDRILAAYTVMTTVLGIPLVYLGDEYGQLNDHGFVADPEHSDDNRWMHRPVFDWARLEAVENAFDPETRLLQGIRRLLHLHKELPELAGPHAEPLLAEDRAVVAFRRRNQTSALTVAVNLADRPAWFRLDVGGVSIPDGDDVAAGPVHLDAYGTLLVRHDAHVHPGLTG